MEHSNTDQPQNNRNYKISFVIKSPGSPGIIFIKNASEILPACRNLIRRLSTRRHQLQEQGDTQKINDQRLNKRFTKFMLCAVAKINGHFYHSNLVIFRLEDHVGDNFNFEQFMTAADNFFQFEGIKYIKIKFTNYTRNETTFQFNYRFYSATNNYSVSEFIRRLYTLYSYGIKFDGNILIPSFSGCYYDTELDDNVNSQETLVSYFNFTPEYNVSLDSIHEKFINSYPILNTFFQQMNSTN